jgi:DNA mismatch repair protein MLH1
VSIPLVSGILGCFTPHAVTQSYTAETTSASTSKKKVAPKNLIRTSAADRTLDSMFPVVPSNRTPPQSQPQTQAAADGGDEEPVRRENSKKTKEMPESACELSSIKDLRKRILVKEHQGTSPASALHPTRCSYSDTDTPGLHEVLEGHVFVGIVDPDRCLSLVQHSTQLYLLNHGSLA